MLGGSESAQTSNGGSATSATGTMFAQTNAVSDHDREEKKIVKVNLWLKS